MTSPGTDAASLGAMIARTRWLLLDLRRTPSRDRKSVV